MGISATRIPHSWPARRDPDFRQPDSNAIIVGDTCHEWTIFHIIEHVTYSFSVCGGTCFYDSEYELRQDIQYNGRPSACVPDSNYHVEKCVPTATPYLVFFMVCSCGTIREKIDPFDSRKCQQHAANLRDFNAFTASLSALAGSDNGR
jgi:hypothetical protein